MKLLLPIILLLVCSCAKTPATITMDSEKLVNVLADLHIAEEMIAKFRAEDKDSVRLLYLKEIRTIHQVDTSILYSDINILQENPELGLEIYTQVYTKLEGFSRDYDPTKKDKASETKDKEETKVKNKIVKKE